MSKSVPTIALFGGSFDPPHLAHRQVAKFLLADKGFQEVWIVPASKNPFKKISTPFYLRAKMCALNFADLSDRLKILSEEKFQYIYTIDLVKALKTAYPNGKFSWVIGSDLKTQLSQWKDFAKLKNMIDFYELPRGGEEASPFLPISATQVREAKQQGKPWQKFLLASVAQFVEEHHLYEKP